jgi:UDP-glucose 4-epimerase
VAIDGLNKVLVVGASGRVGKMLAQAWTQDGFRPVLQHRGPALPFNLPQLCWVPGQAALPQHFSTMIVLAGVVPGKGDLADNARIAETCLMAAQTADIGQVLIASSSAVYGSNGGEPFKECEPLLPVNDYGRAKRAMEQACAPFRESGMQVCALRIGNVVGADALMLNVAAGHLVHVDQFADGAGPKRSYIGPQTMARVLARVVGRDLPNEINLAAPHPVAMADLAEASGADWSWQPAPPTAHQNITLDCSRLSTLFAFSPPESTAQAMVAQYHSLRGAA